MARDTGINVSHLKHLPPKTDAYEHPKRAPKGAPKGAPKRAVNEEMATTQSSENVSLKGPEDWEAWNTQFESKAISTDLWRLISPEEGQEDTEPFAEKPNPPKIGDYDKKLTRETRSQSAQSSATAQASQPAVLIEEVDHANKPRTAAEMTTAARQAFQLDWTLYQHDFKIYTAEREAIDKLRN